MKKNDLARLAWLLCLPFILLTECNKKIDKLPDESTLCSIRWITVPANNPTQIGPIDTIRFSYDSHGNPVTISRLETATELNDYVFWYDNQHRLTDVIGTFFLPAPSGSGFDTWDKLYYTNGRVTLDTLFDFGYINGTRPIPLSIQDSVPRTRRISSYEYDSKGRISKIVDNFNGSFVEIIIYAYDGKGNLARLGVSGYFPQNPAPHDTLYTTISGYDNKVNVNRTNPIWQFLDRDYSVNNRFTADQYNAIGLPVVIPGNRQSSFELPGPFSFLHSPFSLTIQYNCQLPGTGGAHSY